MLLESIDIYRSKKLDASHFWALGCLLTALECLKPIQAIMPPHTRDNVVTEHTGKRVYIFLVAEKSCYLQEQSSKLFFSLREYFFSLIKFFLFSIWTVKTSLRLVLTTIQISKKKNLIEEKKNSLSEKKLRLRALFFQSNVFPATRNIY